MKTLNIMKNMKKKYIAGASVVALAGILAASALLTGFTGNEQPAATVRTTALKKGGLSVSVSATGTVYSTESTSVYSNLNYPVKTVLVSAGDTVKEGDVLAELDVSGLEMDIAQKKASVSSSQASASQNLAAAQNDLATYKRNAESGNDTSLANAEAAVASAELELKNAALDVQSAELDVESANNNLYAARRDLSDARDDYEDESDLYQYKDNLRSCETASEKADTNLEKAKSNYEKAKANLDKAIASNETAKVSSSDTLVSYQNKVKSAQIGTNFSDQQIAIQKLEADLEKAVITAPASGTVTAVNAVEGGSGSGLLFIIQDTSSLKVVTNIKEYDIGAVAVGNKVMITTDATGDEEFEGSLSKIAPTSTLTAEGGASSSSTDAEYESEVKVSPAGSSGLRIGMNAQLSIITEEKQDIYAVPYDAVSKTQGEAVVYEAKQQEDGSFIAQAIPVTTGLENDLYIEVDGDALTDGMLIISDVSGISDGMAVEIRGMSGGQGANAKSGEVPSGEIPAGGKQSGGAPMIGGGMGGGPGGGFGG